MAGRGNIDIQWLFEEPSAAQPTDKGDAEDEINVLTIDPKTIAKYTVIPEACPSQTNSFDCGVAVITYAFHIVAGIHVPEILDFSV